MPDIEEIRDYYFNYLTNEVFDAILNANDYNCIDFNVVKIDLLVNLKKILETRKDFNEKVKVLSIYERDHK